MSQAAVAVLDQDEILPPESIQEIIRLHNEAKEEFMVRAIRIGELLHEVKGQLKHGEYQSWVSKNLSFTPRTALNYVNLFVKKLKTESVSVLALEPARKTSKPKKERPTDV